MPRSGSIDGSDVHSLSGGVIHDELRIKDNKLRRKGTAFPSGISPKPSADIAKPSFDEQAVRSKWIWNRRKDRLNDTQQWLESKGLLKPEDRESLKSLSSQDKQRLQKLLRVSRIKEGVKSPEARLKIRAQVVLIAARTGNLDQAAEHRKRLTERHFYTKTRLYHSLDPETFFSFKKVAGHSEELRAKGRLFREVSSQRDKSYDMGYIGPKLVNPKELRKAVKSLIDKKLVDEKTSFDLRCVLARERARDPNQVQESDLFRTTDLLWRKVRHLMATNKNVRAHMAGFKSLTFTGSRLNRPKGVQKAVNMLLENDMLDKKSAWNLRKTFEHMPNRINILMDIDRKQVPDSKDREKIRAAILLRTAHFGTEEGRRFKDELLSKNVRYKIDIPKTDQAETRKDVAIVKKSMDLQHPESVSKRYADEHGDSVGIPMYEDYKDVDFTNDNRRMDIPLKKPCHALLPPLASKGRSDNAVIEQWHAMAQKDFNPATAPSAYGADAKDIEEAIADIVDRTYEHNNMSTWVPLHEDKAKARELLKAVNHQLPRDLPMPERLQALGEASAIFLQRNDDPSQKPSGKTALPYLKQAYDKWPVRERYVGEFTLQPIQERKLEDSEFVKKQLFEGVYFSKIGSDYIFSPALRRLIESEYEQFKQQNNEATKKTLNTVFGDAIPEQDKNEIFRLLQKQQPFLGDFHGTLRSWGLNYLEDSRNNDLVQPQRLLKPLQEKMRQMTESPPPPDPHHRGSKLSFQPSQNTTIVFDGNDTVVDENDVPKALSVQREQNSHKALLGAIVMGKFAEHFSEEIESARREDGFVFTTETIKNCLTDAVNATLEDCKEIEGYSFDDAQNWIKAHRKDPRRRKSVANINDNNVKPRRMTKLHLTDLNNEWNDLGNDPLAPRKPVGDDFDEDAKYMDMGDNDVNEADDRDSSNASDNNYSTDNVHDRDVNNNSGNTRIYEEEPEEEDVATNNAHFDDSID